MLSRAPVLVFALDADGVCTYSDGAGLQLIGLRPGEVVGVNMFEMYADDAATVATMRRALAGETFLAEYRRETGPCFDTWWLPTWQDGVVTGALGISLDVTDRVRAIGETALYRAFVEAAPQFIAIAGLDGQLRYVNPGGRQMIGMPDEVDVTTTTVSDYLTPEGLALRVEVEQPAVVREGRYEGETTLRHWPSGGSIPVRVSSFLVRDLHTGEPTSLATVQADITEVVEARQAMEQALAYQRGLLLHLHEAQEAERQRIAGDVHDDTIQVLAAVNLRLHTLRRRLAVESASDDVFVAIDSLDDAVRAATTRLRAMLVELDPPSVLDLGLAQLVRQQAEAVLHDVGVQLSVDVAVGTEPTETVGRILMRIAQEVLTNVRKHAHAERAWLEISERDGHYHLRVRDDGVGLAGHRADPRHLGLRSMADRAESVGGWCAVSAPLDGGTRVDAMVPARIGHPDVGELGPSQRLFLEQTMESITDAYVAIDNDWRYVYMNSAGYRLLERDPADTVIGKVLWAEFEIPPEFEKAYRRARSEQVQVEVRGYYAPWDKWIENRIFPTRAGLSIFARDVSEEVRVAAEAEAHRRLIATGRDVVVTLTSETSLLPALRGAAQRLVDGWGLAGVRMTSPGGEDRDAIEVVVGEVTPEHARLEVPLAVAGTTVGAAEIFGAAGLVDLDLLKLFALRIAGD